MIWINAKRILKTGFVNFWRNGVVSISAILVMSITLLIISSVIFNGAVLDHTLETLKESVDVNITFLPEATEQEILNLKETLLTFPEVASVEYISREDVLINYKARHADDPRVLRALDILEDNPFFAMLNIRAVNPDDYQLIYLYLAENYPTGRVDSIIDNVNYAQKQVALERLSNIITGTENLGFIIATTFILLSILITLNTIRLIMYISKDEIRVMNLVGAESEYISGPFAVMGAIYGIVSSFLVVLVLYPVTYWLSPLVINIFGDFNLFNYYIANFGRMFLIILGSGIIIGAISSMLAINRYLKH